MSDRPYSIVIVDDEPLVTFGVSAMLNNRPDRFHIVGTFRDGAPALDFCRLSPPDILLTDICMPGLDGLSLIEAVKPLCPEMKIVVLSCHEEFNLVHRAFRLGANEYLLKHNLEKDAFFDMLSDILPDSGGLHEPTTVGRDGDPLPEGSGTIGIIGFKNEYDVNWEPISWSPDLDIIRQIVGSELNGPRRQVCFRGPRDEILIFLPADESGDTYLPAHHKRKMDAIRVLLANYVNRTVFLALSMTREQGTRHAYTRALRIMDQKFHFQGSRLLFDDRESPTQKDRIRPVFTIAGSDRLGHWKSLLADYLDQSRSLEVPLSRLRSDLAYALHHLSYELEELSTAQNAPMRSFKDENAYERLVSFDDRKVLQDWVDHKLEEACRYLRALRESRTVSGAAKEYIEAHFMDTLTLTEIAAYLNITPSHLSTCFKQEAGISFVEFINRTRIGHACDLLAATDLTVKEIAYRVGYDNPNYFSRLFKKLVGNTVRDYRKSIIDDTDPISAENRELFRKIVNKPTPSSDDTGGS